MNEIHDKPKQYNYSPPPKIKSKGCYRPKEQYKKGKNKF